MMHQRDRCRSSGGRRPWPIRLVALALLGCSGGGAWAQPAGDEPEWTETAPLSPPAFDTHRLVAFDGNVNSSLTYGVDPATITYSPVDGLLRYVLVASNASGATNVMYEAIHCATGRFKTYARYSAESGWNVLHAAQWQAFSDNLPSKHAQYFARAGACEGRVPVTSAAAVVQRLQHPSADLTN